MTEDDKRDADKARSIDPERGAFDPPHHRPLRDPETNPRGVRHIDETAQDNMAVVDRPRYQAAQGRRSRMIAAATRALRGAAKRRPARLAAPLTIPGRPRKDMEATPAPEGLDEAQVIELSWDETIEALTALEGSRVAVRVVERSDPETLVAVFRGLLGAATHGKRPTVFWPVRAASEGEPGDVEETGIYLHRDRFQRSVASLGRTVLHIVQGPVIVNVRGV